MVLGLSNKISGGGHTTGYGALSCTRSGGGVPAGPTIDAHLAGLPDLGDGVPFRAVRLGGEDSQSSIGYSACAMGARQPASILIDPTAAFNVLFGSVAQGRGRQTFQEKSECCSISPTATSPACSRPSRAARASAPSSRPTWPRSRSSSRARSSSARWGPQLEPVKPDEPCRFEKSV